MVVYCFVGLSNPNKRAVVRQHALQGLDVDLAHGAVRPNRQTCRRTCRLTETANGGHNAIGRLRAVVG
jgi:hypothetical protein